MSCRWWPLASLLLVSLLRMLLRTPVPMEFVALRCPDFVVAGVRSWPVSSEAEQRCPGLRFARWFAEQRMLIVIAVLVSRPLPESLP